MLFRSLVDQGVCRKRRNGLCPKYPLSSLLQGYRCSRPDEHISYGNMGLPVPPFGLEFSSVKSLERVLAVANEEGIVRLYNTVRCENPILKEWMAHENAIFDLAWVPGENSVVTASGDQTAKLWDVQSGEMIGAFKGHHCSLKSVAFSKQQKAVFCTGGRDGNIMVWDTRCSKKDGFYRQVKQISGAHNKSERNTPSQVKKRRPGTRGLAHSQLSQQSVTVVLFQDEHTLISSGAVDGVIKMWDLRKSYTAQHSAQAPLQTYPYPGSSTRKLGYSGLVLDSTGSLLVSNCTDDNIYMFNVSGMKTSPEAVFSGHLNSSFYVKSTISPDDQFLASGSSDHHTYIWKISDPKCPPMLLQGHSQEVTSITWSPTDFTKIATCSDDNTVRVWRLDRGTEGHKSTVGQANLVGWAGPKTPPTGPYESSPKPGRQEVRTPAKPTRGERMEGLASPQLAACPPSGASLPPSSSAACGPLGSSATRGSAPGHRPPLSIESWLACSPGSPAAVAASPTPGKVLSPRRRPGGSAPSERRAKRRLDAGGERPGSCVAELFPTAKRSRPPTDTRTPRPRGPGLDPPGLDPRGLDPPGLNPPGLDPRGLDPPGLDPHGLDPPGLDPRGLDPPGLDPRGLDPPGLDPRAEPSLEGGGAGPAAPTQSSSPPGKENCSPGRGDWLSMMGQRRKNGSLRSPSHAKKPDGRSSPSAMQQSPQNGRKISSYFQRTTLE